jgi:hypothetical protein
VQHRFQDPTYRTSFTFRAHYVTLMVANSYDAGRQAGGSRDAGGHYAAHEATELLPGDIRRFYATLA